MTELYLLSGITLPKSDLLAGDVQSMYRGSYETHVDKLQGNNTEPVMLVYSYYWTLKGYFRNALKKELTIQ
jgi:hypothetical protein